MSLPLTFTCHPPHYLSYKQDQQSPDLSFESSLSNLFTFESRSSQDNSADYIIALLPTDQVQTLVTDLQGSPQPIPVYYSSLTSHQAPSSDSMHLLC